MAARYFMLGETTGTSAGGTSEAGKALRVPGTNPFFTMDDALQANRFHDLLQTMPQVEVYIVKSAEPPTGVGEPATPVIAPAVANALTSITGKSFDRLPLQLTA